MTIVADSSAQSALAQGLITPEQFARAEKFGLRWVDLQAHTVSPELLKKVPPEFARAREVMPYAFADDVMQVALAEPASLDVIDDLAFLTGYPIEAVLAPRAMIQEAISRHYPGDPVSGADVEAAGMDVVRTDELSGDATEADAPIIRLVHRLIAEAARRRASDIHLEPLERRFRVRFRIDGVLIEVDAPPKSLQLAVISRIKIMANISIAEKRVPQDGRIQFEDEGRRLDLRVSSMPTAHGESVVMRLLDPVGLAVGLPELGFLPDHQEAFERSIASPDGIVLVTGPTGSGKTTTLYASLQHLNRPDRKIITVEDPVEYQLAGINQVPVNAATGMTFAAALRAMLRQAPNVVMVGEIRDRETADIALNAALTGHTVFSTLHTNDAPSAVTRLIDLGAKPFLVAAGLRAVVAQRLVRRICLACKRPHEPSGRELQAAGLRREETAGTGFALGAGCAACHGTGYRGQVGLFEVLPIGEAMRACIYDNVTASGLRSRARADGMRTLREDGIRKVLAGLTTIEEVVAVTVADPL